MPANKRPSRLVNLDLLGTESPVHAITITITKSENEECEWRHAAVHRQMFQIDIQTKNRSLMWR